MKFHKLTTKQGGILFLCFDPFVRVVTRRQGVEVSEDGETISTPQTSSVVVGNPTGGRGAIEVQGSPEEVIRSIGGHVVENAKVEKSTPKQEPVRK